MEWSNAVGVWWDNKRETTRRLVFNGGGNTSVPTTVVAMASAQTHHTTLASAPIKSQNGPAALMPAAPMDCWDDREHTFRMFRVVPATHHARAAQDTTLSTDAEVAKCTPIAGWHQQMANSPGYTCIQSGYPGLLQTVHLAPPAIEQVEETTAVEATRIAAEKAANKAAEEAAEEATDEVAEWAAKEAASGTAIEAVMGTAKRAVRDAAEGAAGDAAEKAAVWKAKEAVGTAAKGAAGEATRAVAEETAEEAAWEAAEDAAELTDIVGSFRPAGIVTLGQSQSLQIHTLTTAGTTAAGRTALNKNAAVAPCRDPGTNPATTVKEDGKVRPTDRPPD